MPGLDPRRADLASVGAVLIDTLLGVARRRRDHAVRLRAARRAGPRLHQAQRGAHPHRGAVPGRPPAQRRSSWASAATTGRSTRSRSRRLSLALFDATREQHGLGPREREWLEYAALLHDIGIHISYESHHKHSLLPHPARRPARLRSGGNRDHRPRRAVPPAGDAGEVARGVRRAAAQAGGRPSGSSARSCGWPKGSTAATPRSSPASTPSRPTTTACSSGCSAAGDAELELWAAGGTPRRSPTVFETDIRFEIAGGAKAAAQEGHAVAC